MDMVNNHIVAHGITWDVAFVTTPEQGVTLSAQAENGLQVSIFHGMVKQESFNPAPQVHIHADARNMFSLSNARKTEADAYAAAYLEKMRALIAEALPDQVKPLESVSSELAYGFTKGVSTERVSEIGTNVIPGLHARALAEISLPCHNLDGTAVQGPDTSWLTRISNAGVAPSRAG